MTDNKETLQDVFNLDTFDQEVTREKLAEIANHFIATSIKMKMVLAAEPDDESVNDKYEARTIKITMPKAAWESVDLMEQIFSLLDEAEESSKIPQGMYEAAERNAKIFDATLQETLVSQAALDNIGYFASTMAQAAIKNKLESLANNPEKLEAFLKEVMIDSVED